MSLDRSESGIDMGAGRVGSWVQRRGRFGALGLVAALAALAALPTGVLAARSHASITLRVPAAAATGTIVPFTARSSYGGPNGTHYLSVFLVPPAGRGCPHSARPPRGANVLLANEQVDNYLTLNVLSETVNVPGTWSVCVYLTYHGRIAAAKTASVVVSGPGKLLAKRH